MHQVAGWPHRAGDQHVPVIVMAPRDAMFDKTVSNMQEVMARGGKVLLITDQKGAEAGDGVWETILMPQSVSAPILYAMPAQLLPHAVAKGTDVDNPQPCKICDGGMMTEQCDHLS